MKKQSKISVCGKLSPGSVAFYKFKFWSVRQGSSYILESIPHLVAQTRKEIEEILDKTQISTIINAIAKRLEHPLTLTGDLPVCSGSKDWGLQVENLPKFTRVVLEMMAIPLRGKIEPASPPLNYHSVRFEISLAAEEFLSQIFTSITNGAVFFLEAFIEWSEGALKGIAPSIKRPAEHILRSVPLDDPQLAGHLLPIFFSSKGAKPSREQILSLPIFARAALEVACQIGGTKVQTSPKCPPTVLDSLAEIFGNVNCGSDFVINVFPRLYYSTVCDLLPRFTQAEIRYLAEIVTREPVQLSPYSSGDLLALLADKRKESEKEISASSKFIALTPFERVCMEVHLHQMGN